MEIGTNRKRDPLQRGHSEKLTAELRKAGEGMRVLEKKSVSGIASRTCKGPEARKNQQGLKTDKSSNRVKVGEVGMDQIRMGLIDQAKEFEYYLK